MPPGPRQLDRPPVASLVISRWWPLSWMLVMGGLLVISSFTQAQPYARRSLEAHARAHSHTERQFKATPAFSPILAPRQANYPTTVWGQETFVIPYQWSGRQDANAASQVVLNVSQDEGRTWAEASRARSDVQSFLYRASGDGTYWFAVRTIDRTGRQWPAGLLKPELAVVVDTQIPVFKTVTAQIDASGRIEVNCLIEDATADPTSLSVAFQSTDGNWLPVAMSVDPQHRPGMPLRARGVAQASAGIRQAPVRANISDAASHPAAAGAMATYMPMSPRSPTATPVRPFGMATVGAPLIDPRTNAFANSSATAPPALPQVVPPYPAATSSPFSLSSATSSSALLSSASRPAGGLSDPFLSAPPLAPSNRPIGSSDPLTTQNPFAASPAPVSQPSTAEAWPPDHRSASPYHPVSAARSMQGSRVAAAPSFGTPAATGGGRYQFASQPMSPAATSTSALNTLTVNQTRFELEYDLQSVGEWGVAKVELWGTDNGGQSWRRYAVDSDNRSPITAVVPAAGDYGFRVLVQSVGGLEALPPEPGDQPDLRVLVDIEPPQVQLGAVHQGEGYFNDHLVINWQAADPNLAPRPVSLSYSSRPQGPWMPIATSLDNTGRYAWRLQRHLPSALLVRLEVRDSAGNVATSVTPQPLPLHLPQAAGRIRAVRPLASP